MPKGTEIGGPRRCGWSIWLLLLGSSSAGVALAAPEGGPNDEEVLFEPLADVLLVLNPIPPVTEGVATAFEEEIRRWLATRNIRSRRVLHLEPMARAIAECNTAREFSCWTEKAKVALPIYSRVSRARLLMVAGIRSSGLETFKLQGVALSIDRAEELRRGKAGDDPGLETALADLAVRSIDMDTTGRLEVGRALRQVIAPWLPEVPAPGLIQLSGLPPRVTATIDGIVVAEPGHTAVILRSVRPGARVLALHRGEEVISRQVVTLAPGEAIHIQSYGPAVLPAQGEGEGRKSPALNPSAVNDASMGPQREDNFRSVNLIGGATLVAAGAIAFPVGLSSPATTRYEVCLPGGCDVRGPRFWPGHGFLPTPFGYCAALAGVTMLGGELLEWPDSWLVLLAGLGAGAACYGVSAAAAQ